MLNCQRTTPVLKGETVIVASAAPNLGEMKTKEGNKKTSRFVAFAVSLGLSMPCWASIQFEMDASRTQSSRSFATCSDGTVSKPREGILKSSQEV